ncbi:MAG: amidohydrolase [Candidatus Bipolaricaulaceae bacterium]
MSVDLILYHGPVLLESPADAVAVRCGRIAAVDRTEEIMRLRGPRTEMVDLGGRPVLPGFFDAHVHFLHEGLTRTFFVDLSPARSLADALERLVQAGRDRPQGWVVGQGWDESRWTERRYLERSDLDRAVPHQPCCAVRVDGHLVVANTSALARCTRPEGDRVDRELGHLWEEAAGELLACAWPEREVLADAVAAACERAAALGITAVADMGGEGLLAACQLAQRRGRLSTRVFCYLPLDQLDELRSLGVMRGLGSERLRIMGVKAFMDGSIGARTAAVAEPYVRGGSGQLLLERAEVVEAWRQVEAAGLQFAVHAIGERAVEEALAAARQARASSAARHRLEHLELATAAQLDRLAELGLVASMQPNFPARWSGPGRMYVTRLGEDRDARIDPHAWVMDRGIPLAFGSDGMPMGPLCGIGGVLDPPHPPQRLPLEAALRAYTSGGAYATWCEEELGRVAPGYRADLVVLSADPRSVPWAAVDVDMTLVDGKRVYERA